VSRARIVAAIAAAAGVLVVVLVALVVVRSSPPRSSSPPPPESPPAPGSITADSMLQSFNHVFLMQSNGTGYYRLTTAGDVVSFFKQIELIEMTEDAYLRSRSPSYKALIGELFKGLIERHGYDWLKNPSNDDLMWATIACVRAYRITGDSAYLSQARQTFDRTYARSWDGALGGGLWNTTGRLAKNTCVNSPAVIAGVMLYQSLHDAAYLAKAKALYRWLRARLFDPASGAVYDHISPGPGGSGPALVSRTAFTYDQGGFIGAANALYRITAARQYYDDALKALAYTREHLTVGGVLKGEITDVRNIWASAGGFKGMFVRWASIFITDNHVRGYGPWFRRNVAAVESHVNAAGLVNEDWPAQTGNGTLTAFSCSSAVVLLQWYPPAASAR
jgi:hypothetical protein